jgi:hypothetical protein
MAFVSQAQKKIPWLDPRLALGQVALGLARETSLDISSPRWMRRQPSNKEVATWQTLPVRLSKGSSPG